MFPSSSLHLDFARQVQQDRLAAVRVARRPRRSERPSALARVAAALSGRPTRLPAPDTEASVPASA